MKTKLEFNLPEEKDDFLLAIHGNDFYCVIQRLDMELRNKLKYGNSFETADDALENIRAFLHELMEELNLSFDI